MKEKKLLAAGKPSAVSSETSLHEDELGRERDKMVAEARTGLALMSSL
jgi:hypothetical protein